MIIVNVEQGTPEWHQARAGRISASCMDKIISPTGVKSKQADKYMAQLAAEKITGIAQEGFEGTAAMKRGKELEAEAANYYAMLRGVELERIGYCHTDDGLIGCSPDFLVGDDGLLEVKVTNGDTCIEYILSGKLVQEYTPQLQCQLFVTGRKWVDIMCYMPGAQKQLIERVSVNPDFSRDMIAYCMQANAVLADKLQQLKDKGFYNE